MPALCCICGGSNIPLFKFPSKEPLKSQWKKSVGIDKITSGIKVCIKHFSKEAIVSSREPDKPNGRIRLRRNAVPLSISSLNQEYNESWNAFQKINKYPRVCLLCNTRDEQICFRFPDDLQRRNEWLRRCGRGPDSFNGDKEPFKERYLCSRHFAESDICRKRSLKGRNILRKDALPTILIAVPESSSESVPTAEKYCRTGSTTFPDETTAEHRSPSPPFDISCIVEIDTLENEVTIHGDPVTEHRSPSPPSDISCTRIVKIDTRENEVTVHGDPVTEHRSLSPPSDISCIAEIDTSTNEMTFHDDLFTNHTLPATIDELLATHSNCPVCITFVQHFDPSTTYDNISSTPSTSTMSRSAMKRRIRYVGDISTTDLATPKGVRQSFLIAKEEVLKCRHKIDILQKRMKRLKDGTMKYKKFLTHLKNEGLISKNAYSTFTANFT